MSPQIVSLISTGVNLGLGISKLIFGILIGSVSLVADGLHSGMDVFSSFITFFGIRKANKPVDKEHPYGYWKAEEIAGFFVSILLAITGIGILYEAVMRFFGGEPVRLSIWAVVVVIASILVTEILARIKFYYGTKAKSLALVADAEHSRADALSSVGVLIGLFLIRYFSLADAIVAIGIGIYILFEAFEIGKEITDSLLDVSNKDVEERIKKICASHDIDIDFLRTRKIGAYNIAELKIRIPLKLKIGKVQDIISTLENRILSNIPELKEIIISIKAYNVSRTIVLPMLGKRIGDLKGFERIGPKKIGNRVIIPLKNNKISEQFGAKQYMVIDKKNNKIVKQITIQNPYYSDTAWHSARFAKAIRADKVLTRQIGDNAKQSLENFGINVEIIDKNAKIKNIIEYV